MIPTNATFSNGVGVVPDATLNTFVQTVQTFVQLRNFIGLTGMALMAQGGVAAGDGEGGLFFWTTGNYTDNGSTVIVPSGAAGQGAWLAATLGASSDYLPLTGGTVSGPLTLSYTGTALTVTDNATIGGTLGVGGLTASGAVALSPANANVVISPTGSGLVTINPATTGSLNNMTGQFTALSATGAFTPAQVAGIVGTTTNNNAQAGSVGEDVNSTVPNTTATVTITIASPGVITWTAHGLGPNTPVQFATSGALPTGLSAGVTYYIVGVSITTNTFEVATSIANAIGNTPVNTTGTQSGTQTAVSTAFMTTGTPINITAISLTAGDWDIWATVGFVPGGSTTISLLEGAINSVSATLPTAPGGGAFAVLQATFTTGAGQVIAIGQIRQSISTTTIYYLIGNCDFGVGAMSGYGFIGARRRR